MSSLGYHAPAADYAWLQAIQYYGGYRQGAHDLRYFDGLVEAVTTLDPRFVDAYVFAALVHSLDTTITAGAVDLLKRGLLHNPTAGGCTSRSGSSTTSSPASSPWRGWFALAAEQPGASDFCRRFAAWSAKRGGDLQGSLYLWENLRRTTDNPDMRELAANMVAELEAALAGAPLPGEVGPPAPSAPRGRP